MSLRADASMDFSAAAVDPATGDGVEVAPTFLATAAATPRQRRLALAVVVLSTVVFVAALPFAKVKLARVDAFIPAYEAALIVTDLVTAVLLLGQFTKLRSRALLALAAGYLFDALVIVPHALSYPGVFGPGGVIGGGAQTTVWLYILWHAGFPVFVIAYAWLKGQDGAGESARATPGLAIAAAAFVVVVVVGATVAITAGDPYLPPLMAGTGYSPIAIFFLGAAWLVSIVALAALWWRGLRTVLDLWVAVVMCAWVFDIGLSAVLNGGRFDLGFYFGRGYGLLAASFVLVVVLLETSGLFSRLAEQTVELKGEAEKLKGHVREGLARQKEIEDQLRQAQKMEAIGNLTGGMAHDFNNLLAVVIGNLDLLVQRRPEDRDVQELGIEARDAALQGADLTRRLLAFARRQPLQPQQVKINDLVTDHAKLLRRLLGARIDVQLHLSPIVWAAIVDPTQLEAALTNLATNARDAMPNGGNLVIATSNRHLDSDYAASHPEVGPGDYALIEVSDTGSGIPPDLVERIFEPFFTTKEAGKGSGLGLSMVYGFMKQSKGHVSVYSETGIGTTFRLYLPRVVQQQDTVAPAAAIEDLRGNGETVLAVEDVALLRKVVVRQLDELGYKVLEADSATAALAVLEAKPVDILFTDVIIAGSSTGFDLARAARSRWPNLRVVFTSGFPDTKLAKGSGPTISGKLLGKPFRKEDLARALREAIDSPT